MASRVTETTKLKSLMQEPELRVKPELQEVQVSGLPWQVRQLVMISMPVCGLIDSSQRSSVD